MPQFAGSVTKYPARASFIWYVGLIALGAIVLALPFSRGESARPISTLDAFFTSTSATCVTGLTVRSTEHDFSFVGQLAILVLIQLGGMVYASIRLLLHHSFKRLPVTPTISFVAVGA